MPLHVFGYGSLLFRPDFPHEDRSPARLHGYQRRLDQGSPDHRGTPERLGRVVTLARAEEAVTHGLVFHVADQHAESVLAALDHREKGGYERIHVEVFPLGGGPALRAVTWIAPPGNPYHLGPASLAAMVTQIREAVGPSGRNVDYVLRLAETLRTLGIPDPHLEEVERALVAS